MSVNDGGSAFPTHGREYSNLRKGDEMFVLWDETPQPGMSLRTYFAAAALHGLVSNPQYEDSRPLEIARRAYALADAMVATGQQEVQS